MPWWEKPRWWWKRFTVWCEHFFMKPPEEIKHILLLALDQYKGDSLERAERAFNGLSVEQMNQSYGASGETRQQILDGYREHRRRVQAAIDWVWGDEQ